LALTVFIAWRLFLAAIMPSPEAILRKIPIGCKVADLKPYLDELRVERDASVTLYIPTTKPPDEDPLFKDGAVVKTDYGVFLLRNVDNYDVWKASAAERESFTGSLTFFRFDSLGNGQAIEFIFIGGRFKKSRLGLAARLMACI
jgi:hypothetical protein